jgi:hypothetical protein
MRRFHVTEAGRHNVKLGLDATSLDADVDGGGRKFGEKVGWYKMGRP